MKKTIAVVAGDGIGPEITAEAVRVLKRVAELFGHDFSFDDGLIGGAAYDAVGDCLPAETLEACKNADAVLLGAVGGPKWDSLPAAARPERRALLTMRRELGLFANLRPAKVWGPLAGVSPLKPEALPQSYWCRLSMSGLISSHVTRPFFLHICSASQNWPRE